MGAEQLRKGKGRPDGGQYTAKPVADQPPPDGGLALGSVGSPPVGHEDPFGGQQSVRQQISDMRLCTEPSHDDEETPMDVTASGRCPKHPDVAADGLAEIVDDIVRGVRLRGAHGSSGMTAPGDYERIGEDEKLCEMACLYVEEATQADTMGKARAKIQSAANMMFRSSLMPPDIALRLQLFADAIQTDVVEEPHG